MKRIWIRFGQVFCKYSVFLNNHSLLHALPFSVIRLFVIHPFPKKKIQRNSRTEIFLLFHRPFKMVPLDPIPSEYNRVKGNLVPSNVLEFKTTFEQRFKAGLNAVPK